MSLPPVGVIFAPPPRPGNPVTGGAVPVGPSRAFGDSFVLASSPIAPGGTTNTPPLWRPSSGAPPPPPSNPPWWSDLWEHQQEGILFLDGLRGKGEDRGLVVVPGAGGKTRILAGYILRRLPTLGSEQKMLVIVHSDEMMNQTIVNFEALGFPSEEIGIVQGKKRDFRPQIILATAQTLITCLDELDRYSWDTVGVDEAHHYVEKGQERVEWIDIMKHLGFFDELGRPTQSADRFLIGLTATPDRFDGIHLRDFYGNYDHVFDVDLETLIGRGHVKRVEVIDVSIGDAEGQPLTLCDLEEKSRLEVLNGIRQGPLEGKSWIGFMSDQRQAEWAAENIPDARAVTLETPMEERRETWDLLQEGTVTGVFGVRIPEEALDVPRVDAVLIGMRTKSRSRAVQMAARAARIDLSRSEAERASKGIVIDTGGNIGRLLPGIPIRDFWEVSIGPGGKASWTRSGPFRRTQDVAASVSPSNPRGQETAAEHTSRLLQSFSIEQMKRAAWELGLREEEVLAFRRGERLPDSIEAAVRLGKQLVSSDTHEEAWRWMKAAWVWDKVSAMEKEVTLDPSLSEKKKAWARCVRYLLWSRYRGATTIMARNLGISHTIDEFLQGRTDRWFLAGYRKLVALIREELGEVGLLSFDHAVFENCGWDYPENVDALSRRERLLFETRRAVARIYGGNLPQKPEGLPEQVPGSPLLNWLSQGTFLSSNTAHMSRRQFFIYIGRLLKQGGVDRGRVADLMERAIFEERNWSYPEDLSPLRGDELLLFRARRATARRYGGILPSKPQRLPQQREDAPLTLWLNGQETADDKIRSQARTLIATARSYRYA